MGSIKTFLSQKVSILSSSEKRIFALGTGAFVFLFMLFFQPFGVNNYDPNETITTEFFIIMMIMGVYVSIILWLNEHFIFRLLIKVPTRLKMLLWIIYSIVLLSSAVFLLYNFLGNWHDFIWPSYFEFIGNIGAMSIIPLAIVIFYLRVKGLREKIYQNHSIKSDESITLIADNEKDQFTILLKNLLYIEADDNYVSVYFLKDDQVSKALIRKNLKSIQEENHHPMLLRCHRSYMINLMNVQQAQGNRNKLTVFIHKLDTPIPVSRQYIDAVLNAVSN